MTADASRKVPLFGGAISAHLPTRYVDVSDFRPVPDNQEVWTDASVDESVIVEILERVEEGPSDAEGGAAGWFWEDLAAVSECGPNDAHLTSVTRLSSEHLPAMNGRFAAASVAVGTMKMAKGRERGDERNRNVVEVTLANVRLPEVGTDLLVTVNRPLVVAPGSSAAATTGAGVIGTGGEGWSALRSILETFSVDDWSLFGYGD